MWGQHPAYAVQRAVVRPRRPRGFGRAADAIADAGAAVTPRAVPAAPSKRVAAAMSLLLIVLVASPVLENWKDDPDDSFPLSYYPMFIFDKSDRQRLNYLVGIDAQGNRRFLEFSLVGPGGMNQVRRQMSKLIERKQAPQLCQSVATKVAKSGRKLADVVQVQIVTGTFRMSSFFGGETSPGAEDVRARCAVQRG